LDGLYFDFFVLPLGILVVVLVVSVYHFARKEEKARNKTRKLIQSYVEEKAKEQMAMNKELANLQKMLDNKSIDKSTYERLKNVLVTMHNKERAETSDLVDYVKSKRQHTQRPAEEKMAKT
jgi:uncharacterized membrane protein YhiD involved in acid resistance